jgi:hypothetical protein
MAKHSINLGHHIQFQDTSILILAMKSRCMEHITTKAREIELHPNSMNREESLSCKP